MTASPKSNNAATIFGRPVELFVQVYGPYTFSIVALLIIWYAIVSPHMEQQAIDYRRNEAMVEALRQITITQEQSHRSLERTVEALDNIVERLP